MTSALMPNYDRIDVAFERGEGAYLYAADGRRFLDFAAGVAVTSLGHCHPHLVAVPKDQADRLWHCSNLYRIPLQERLAERLVAASFADAAFFCNSGAEAIECGLKLVRKYHDAAGWPRRYRVVTCTGAFHGRTLATIAAGGSPKHLGNPTKTPRQPSQNASNHRRQTKLRTAGNGVKGLQIVGSKGQFRVIRSARVTRCTRIEEGLPCTASDVFGSCSRSSSSSPSSSSASSVGRFMCTGRPCRLRW